MPDSVAKIEVGRHGLVFGRASVPRHNARTTVMSKLHLKRELKPFYQAVSTLKRKKELPAPGTLRLASWAEGRCAQTVHVGTFSEEGPTIARVHAFIHEHSGLRGKHHGIYLSDIRRAHPSGWKTIIRQPML